MLAVLASRLPRKPIDTPSLDGPGQEGIARGQELPASGDLDVSMLGIPLTTLGRVDIEMLGCEILRARRFLSIAHV